MSRRRSYCILLSALAVMSCSEVSDNETDESSMSETVIVDPNTGFEELTAITPVPVTPRQVWWMRSPMGVNPGSGVPGPTDIMLEAVLDYGDADVVADLVRGVTGVPVMLNVANWHPDVLTAVGSDSQIAVLQHLKLDGFDREASVSVVKDTPSLVILRLLLG